MKNHLANIKPSINFRAGRRPIAIVADMQGPKLRVGEMGEGLELRYGDTVAVFRSMKRLRRDCFTPPRAWRKFLKSGPGFKKFDEWQATGQPSIAKPRRGVDVPDC